MTQITCFYRRTAQGRLALRFAADLVNLLQETSSPLALYLEPGEGEALLLACTQRSPADLIREQNSLVLADAANLTGFSIDEIAVTAVETQGILVDHTMAFERADLDVLYPSRERALLARGRGPILVPFGDSLSAVRAAQIALDLAGRLALPVVFYHTTWKDDTVQSEKPDDHMCNGAKMAAGALKQLAQGARVEFTFAIETADDVADGILQCAMRHSARLIVMPRSAKTTIGCYVNQVLGKTPIPLLAVAARLEKLS